MTDGTMITFYFQTSGFNEAMKMIVTAEVEKSNAALHMRSGGIQQICVEGLSEKQINTCAVYVACCYKY